MASPLLGMRRGADDALVLPAFEQIGSPEPQTNTDPQARQPCADRAKARTAA